MKPHITRSEEREWMPHFEGDNMIDQVSRNTRPTVVVIESQEEDRFRLNQLLTTMEFEVKHFETAEEFLEVRDGFTAGCVLTSLHLRGMSGLELQTRLRECDSPLPVIVVGKRVSTQMIVRVMREGAITFLDLPIIEDAVWLALREAMAENRKRISEKARIVDLNSRFRDLSDGEKLVLKKVCEGLTNKQIASTIDVSVRTVESRRRRLLLKTRSSSLAELLLTYQQFRDSCGGSSAESR